jgi:bifunctional non-homologous end joining protein LigD
MSKRAAYVGGFLRTKGAKSGIRALMLGVHERDGSLRFAGTAKPKLRPSQLRHCS